MTPEQFCFWLIGICEGVGDSPTKLITPAALLERLEKLDFGKNLFVSKKDPKDVENELKKYSDEENICECACHSNESNEPCKFCGCSWRKRILEKHG